MPRFNLPGDLNDLSPPIGNAVIPGWGGVLTARDRLDTDDPANEWGFDVLRWEMTEDFEEMELPIGGRLGASDGRRVGYHTLFALEVAHDLQRPLDQILRGLRGFTLRLDLGDAVRAINYPPHPSMVIDQRYYWCPRTGLLKVIPAANPNARKTVRSIVLAQARGHVFLCPEQGTPTDETTVAGAYTRYYRNL